jgi:hypothetical protein
MVMFEFNPQMEKWDDVAVRIIDVILALEISKSSFYVLKEIKKHYENSNLDRTEIIRRAAIFRNCPTGNYDKRIHCTTTRQHWAGIIPQVSRKHELISQLIFYLVKSWDKSEIPEIKNRKYGPGYKEMVLVKGEQIFNLLEKQKYKKLIVKNPKTIIKKYDDSADMDLFLKWSK